MTGDTIVAVARRFDFVREVGGPNCGAFVNLFQRFTGNKEGDSWCASFVSFVLDIAYKGKSPVGRGSAGCDELLALCRKHGSGNVVPGPGDIVFSVTNGDAHHVGICTAFSGTLTAKYDMRVLKTIAGNTSEDGLSSNGTGVFEHEVSLKDKLIFRLP